MPAKKGLPKLRCNMKRKKHSKLSTESPDEVDLGNVKKLHDMCVFVFVLSQHYYKLRDEFQPAVKKIMEDIDPALLLNIVTGGTVDDYTMWTVIEEFLNLKKMDGFLDNALDDDKFRSQLDELDVNIDVLLLA